MSRVWQIVLIFYAANVSMNIIGKLSFNTLALRGISAYTSD